MQMRVLKPGMLLAATLLTACSSSYFSGITSASVVDAAVASPGSIAWTLATDNTQTPPGIKATSTITQPSVTLTLEPNSSPVTYQHAQGAFYLQNAAADSKGRPADDPIDQSTLSTVYFPFTAFLQQTTRSTSQAPVAPLTQTAQLNGLITTDLIAYTNKSSASGSVVTAVLAKVSLIGTNALGQPVTTAVQVPINVTYTGP